MHRPLRALTSLCLGLLLVPLLAFGPPTAARAQEPQPQPPTAVAGTVLNVRAGPSSQSAKVGQLQPGDRISVLATVQGEAVVPGVTVWHQTPNGFVYSAFTVPLEQLPTQAPGGTQGEPAPESAVAFTDVHVRAAPSTQGPIVAQLEAGERFPVLAITDGEALLSGNLTWFQTPTGFVYSGFTRPQGGPPPEGG